MPLSTLQDVGHADETGWPRGNRQKGWLWAFCCHTAAFFMVHANRNRQAARKLIDSFEGKLVTDRYNAYNFYKLIRQICWAHLKRDFKAISEANGAIGKIGDKLHCLAKKILKFLTWLNIAALLIPKGKRNRENKLYLNEGTILCLLDKNCLFKLCSAVGDCFARPML